MKKMRDRDKNSLNNHTSDENTYGNTWNEAG